MTLWRRLVGHRPIVTRLVLAVAGTMAVILLATGAFVFWRVEFALNRQLDQDLKAYQEVVEKSVADGSTPPSDHPWPELPGVRRPRAGHRRELTNPAGGSRDGCASRGRGRAA